MRILTTVEDVDDELDLYDEEVDLGVAGGALRALVGAPHLSDARQRRRPLTAAARITELAWSQVSSKDVARDTRISWWYSIA